MNKDKLKHQGFTLLELLLYMGILSILLLVFMQIFTSSIDVQQESESASSVSQDAEFILQRLTYDIQRSNTVTVPAVLGGESNSLQIVIDGVNYTYTVSNDDLLLANDIGTDSLNSFDTIVSNLIFKRLGGDKGKNSIVVTFTLTSKIVRQAGVKAKNFQTTIGLR